uniref:DUF4806 domain-containing protein n=1 Tax=Anopheles albimanus TaxID=7167 RepID=A0A182FXD9_ANOAL
MDICFVLENESSITSNSGTSTPTLTSIKAVESANRLLTNPLKGFTIRKVTVPKSNGASASLIPESHSNTTESLQSTQVLATGSAHEKRPSELLLPSQKSTDGTNQPFSLVLEALARITQAVEQNTINLQKLSNEVSQCATVQKQILESLKEQKASISKFRAEQSSSEPEESLDDLKIRVNFVDSSNKQSQVLTLIEQPESPTADGKSLAQVTIKPVDCFDELEKLEKLAENKDFVEAVARCLKRKFVGNYQGGGRTYCHRIVDNFFTRSFMTKCSWTGYSTSGIQKIGLRFFCNVINMFIYAVQYAFPKFTEQEGLKFLKNCVANANGRVHEIQRASTARKPLKRKRISRPKTAVVENSTERCEVDPLMIDPEIDELDIPIDKADPVQLWLKQVV